MRPKRSLWSEIVSSTGLSNPDPLILRPSETDRYIPRPIAHLKTILILSILLIPIAHFTCAEAQEIVDLYSDIRSFDVTVSGAEANDTLRMDLLSWGHALQTKTLVLDGPGTWVDSWDSFEAVEGPYDVRATLMRNGRKISERSLGFSYGGRVPVRFDIRDFGADSRGVHLSILSQDPAIVDIYYMLISDSKAVYVSKEEAVPITGGYGTPSQISRDWKTLLKDGQSYTGRVKIVELEHNQTRAFMSGFVAREDASITETYEDEMGASATVFGKSRVPFEGRLRFTLSTNGSVLETIEKKTPVLLSGDDETVEVSWNRTLEPGIYHLNVLLLGGRGDPIDLEESVIEAENISRPNVSAAQETKKSSGLGFASSAALLAAFWSLRRRYSTERKE